MIQGDLSSGELRRPEKIMGLCFAEAGPHGREKTTRGSHRISIFPFAFTVSIEAIEVL